jgi:hypothetical protein
LSVVAGCGGSDPSLAEQSQAASDHPVAGATPFIASTTIRGKVLDKVTAVNFTIAPQAGSVSKPISVTYASAYLVRRGFVQATSLNVPLFGLYAGTTNSVTVTLTFSDNSSLTLPVAMTTSAFDDAVYGAPQVVVPRSGSAMLGYDFIYMKSIIGSPVIVDTDGHTRWIAAGVTGTPSSTFSDGAFILGGSSAATAITRLELDGTSTTTGTLDTPDVVDFHHDMEPGKTALIDNVDRKVNGVYQNESTAQEFTADGHVLQQWDVGQILSDYMLANGDDPTLFVRPGIDWFHMNTAIYDGADDSIIISSRENFVIKLDYTTGAIRWIFGDPTKYWYSFPSLRAKSLNLLGGGLVPIGQHSINIAPDGNLLLFNNGAASANQPAGAPAGQSRAYSAVSSYTIDDHAMTAIESWHFDYGQTLSAPYCSSTLQFPDGSVLVDYATAENITAARIVGLDASHNIAFDYRYPSIGCSTAWNSQPIHLEALTLQ